MNMFYLAEQTGTYEVGAVSRNKWSKETYKTYTLSLVQFL